MQRTQEEAYTRGEHHARCWQQQALDWIDEAVEDGRRDLQAQRAVEREIDAPMACHPCTRCSAGSAVAKPVSGAFPLRHIFGDHARRFYGG